MFSYKTFIKPYLLCLSKKCKSKHLGFCLFYAFLSFFIFRAPSTWNEQTLKDLGMLPLYLTSTFYNYFDRVSNTRKWMHSAEKVTAFPFICGITSPDWWLTDVGDFVFVFSEQQTKRSFLEYFLGVIKNNGVDRQKRKTLKAEIRNSMKNRRKRSIGESPCIICYFLFMK